VAPRKKKKFGRESSVPFRLTVRSAQSSAQPIRLDGTNAYRPPFERWKIPVAALLLLAGLGSGGYGVVNVCSRDTGVCADLLHKAKEKGVAALTPTVPAKTTAPTKDAGGAATEEPTTDATIPPEPTCPSTRLKPGQDAVIINSETSRTLVRAQPSRDAAVLGQVGSGFKVTTIRCQKATNGEDLIFWEVTLSAAVNGETNGWIAEQDPASKQFLLSPAS
jgi:hypothetical protein